MSTRLIGHCLCGRVSVRLPRPMDDVGVCHCTTCLRWNSGPWMALQAPGAVVTGDTLVVFRSSRFAERGFCGTCGTHIFHRPHDGPELAISAGLFLSPRLHISREIFFDNKPPYYQFVAQSVKRSGMSMARDWLPRIVGRGLRRSCRNLVMFVRRQGWR